MMARALATLVLLASTASAQPKPDVAALAKQLEAPSTKANIAAQVDAIRALGTLGTGATPTLVKLLARPLPQPKQGDAFSMYLVTSGAAINALAELRDPAAATQLILAMYRTPELFMQIRGALTAIGPKAAAELRDVLRGKHAAVTKLFATDKLDRYCDANKQCQPLSAMDFYAAVVLGDLRDASAVPDLLAVIARPAKPVYFVDDAPSPNTSHHGAYDALRRIGAPAAAAAIGKIWADKKQPPDERALAAATYAFVARDDARIDELGAIAADNTADDGLRSEAATAFARLAHTQKATTVMIGLANKYLEAAHKAHDAKTARAYTSYARMFETHAARIAIALRCGSDATCYATGLDTTAAQVGKALQGTIVDLDQWTPDEQAGLVEATLERAMLELGKRGAKTAVDALLDRVADPRHLVWQSASLAVSWIAPHPCPACVAKLDAAIAKTKGDQAVELAIVRNALR